MQHAQSTPLSPNGSRPQESRSRAEEWFQSVSGHYVEAQIAFHFARTGVLEALETRGSATSAELASELHLRPEILTPLLDYFAAISPLVARDGERFVVTPLGRTVLERYGVRDGGRRTFNLFDVRVGAYGPVWSSLGALLRGDAEYGRDIHRTGELASDGLYKLATGLVSPIERVIVNLRSSALVELGPTSGVVQRIGGRHPELACFGIDRKQKSLDQAVAYSQAAGLERATWITSDIHDTHEWLAKVPTGPDTTLVSFHFHEFLAAGVEKMRLLIRRLREAMPGAHLIAVEQPRPREQDRGSLSTTEWWQAHANVLIHHLIENGRCLFEDEWRALFVDEGCRHVVTEDPNWAGEKLFLFRL